MVIHPLNRIVTLGLTPHEQLVQKFPILSHPALPLRPMERPFQFAYISNWSWLIKSALSCRGSLLRNALNTSIRCISCPRREAEVGAMLMGTGKGLGVVHAPLCRQSLSHQPSLVVLCASKVWFYQGYSIYRYGRLAIGREVRRCLNPNRDRFFYLPQGATAG